VNERQRKFQSHYIVEFLSAISPEHSEENIRCVVAGLSDSKMDECSQIAFREMTTAGLEYAGRVCSQHGWFIDMGFPAAPAPQVAELYEQGNGDRADSLLIDYYRERYPSIRDALVNCYRERATLLNKGFHMHDNGEYDVSVPLLLIQADGICSSVFGREFFRVKGNGLAARKSVEQRTVDWIWNAAAEPFRTIVPIAAPRRTSKSLNRHLVLHGRSLDYGTEMNSLKAISLLAFLHGLDAYSRERRQAIQFNEPWPESEQTAV